MNIAQPVKDGSMIDTNPLISPLVSSKLQLVHNTNWKTVEVNGEDVEIPEGWDMSSPSLEKFKIQTGRKNANDNSLDGIYPFFTCSVENVLKISSYSFDTEALLINGNGDVGHVKYYKGKFDAYQRVYVVNNIEMDIHYVRLIFEKYFKSSLSVQGGAMPYIKVDAILNFDFRKPSLDEQTLIAQTLTTQEDHIASLKQQSSIQRKRLDWLTDELLSGRIRVEEDLNSQPTVLKRDEHGEIIDSLPAVKLVANTDWKTVEVNGEEVEIPEGWDMSSPSLEKFKIQTGRKNANDNSLDGIYPFFTCSVENVLKISSYSFDTEALLINGNGDVGHVKYYKGKFDAYQRVYVVNNIEMDIHYVRLIFEKYFKSSLSVQGGAMPYIKVDAILNFDFRKPSLDEQTLIAQTLTAQEEYIASLDQMIAIEEKRLAWLTDELLSGRILIQEVK